jgi:hypothetical protein
MADTTKKNGPLLDPDRELPAPHDMQLDAGTPSGTKDDKNPASPPRKHSLLKWTLYLIPPAIILIFGISIYSLSHQKQEEKSSTPIRAVNITPKVSRVKKTEWKTYKNKTHNFSLQYPKDWDIIASDDEEQYIMRPQSTKEKAKLNGGKTDLQTGLIFDGKTEEGIFVRVFTNEKKQTSSQSAKEMLRPEDYKYLIPANLPGIDATIIEDIPDPEHNIGPSIHIINGTTEIIISSWINDSENDTIKKIFESFKFTNKSSSELSLLSQSVCSMEAKVCPDGSSVGRTGPYCEFAACP